MRAGEVLPGRDPPAEVLHESDRTRVSRLFLTGRTVIRKEPLGPDAERRLRHEVAMLERLRDVAGVAQLTTPRHPSPRHPSPRHPSPRHPGSVELVDVGGTSLAELPSPLPVDVLIGLAEGLARAVAGMHRRGVMHRDITPSNVVLAGDGVPWLVDFALASSIAEVHPEFTHHTQIVGTLAYLAPEQTGRTGRPVDQRADLYALGATLYELATGAPPFGTGDPLRLTHDHLARVPVPPATLNPAVPGPLSEIILHLLEKEPDHRYQTADGVVHDLERVRELQAHPGSGPVRIGERDVPLRLLPQRPVSRDDEVAFLQAAFEDARTGRCRGVLIGGAPGVGKTALVDQLRPVVTSSDGWFVAGKFDQYRRDLEFDAINQAFRALGRLLLAEPEDQLAVVRERILFAVGPNAGLLAAAVPEFAALLAVPPELGNPLTAQVRAQRGAVAALQAVASRTRPVVMVVDDLQWAGPAPLGFVDLVLSEEPVEGLLLVGTYRDVDAAYPRPAPLSRWRDQTGVRHLRLSNLPAPSLVTMIAEMLHADPAEAAGLAEVIYPHASGNPYETVELLNALRRDGLLTATVTGWRWDTAAVRVHLGRSEAAGLPATPVGAIPPPSRRLVETMACLGGRAELGLLQTATGASAAELSSMLAPALDEGLLVIEPGAHDAVRFRHDRIREVILDGLDEQRRRTLLLSTARRLAEVPEQFAVAAEQYLPVADAVEDAAERRRVVVLLRRAAGQAVLVGDHALVNALLAAALRLIDPGETATLIEVHTRRHASLYCLGRLDEADEDFRAIEELCTAAVQRAEATRVQIRSLTQRKRPVEAIALGMHCLRELGITVPAADRLGAELDHRFDYLYRWLDHPGSDGEQAPPDVTEPSLHLAYRVINALVPANAIIGDYAVLAWLSLEALQIWLEHRSARSLIGPAHVGFAAVGLRGDYSAAYRASRRILTLGEARGFEPDTSQARFLFAFLSCWFEPIENGAREAQQARVKLLEAGNLANAGYTYHVAVQHLLDSAPSLDTCIAEVDAGLAFTRRTGNEQTVQWLDGYRWLAEALRGDGADIADVMAPEGYADNLSALFHAHVNRAIAAAVLADRVALARHTTAAMPLLSAAPGQYPTAVARVLRGLSLAWQARDSRDAERDGLLAELDALIPWLAARAADAPDNFLHLLRLVEAERAWTDGDFLAAVTAFDAARREAARRRRPWHRALITECAARFHLAHGLDHTGYDLLAQARQQYAAWGATAKVAQLDWAYPTLRPPTDATAGSSGDQPADVTHRRTDVTTGTLDLLGILSASQALSSETDIDRLHARVVDVLSAMTGATAVRLLLWNDDRHDWTQPAPADGSLDPPVPTSVLRYTRRTGEPLVVTDATSDDRFARDPYFTGLTCCSLLAVPILTRGTPRAVLLLENHLIRGAFTAERLDAVTLIAGQLAVSLDNAHLYAELTTSRARIVTAADQVRRRIERDLHDGAQQRLVTLTLQLQAARAAVPPGAEELATQLDELAAGLTGALDELRDFARGIHPAILAEGGLRPALKGLARRSSVPVELDVRVDRRLPEPIEIAAYYVVSETLTNVAKHAQASAVHVEVETVDDGGDTGGGVLRVRVRDDGRGGADFDGGSGLVGLKDRVESLGGLLRVRTAPGSGTTLRAELPLNPDRMISG